MSDEAKERVQKTLVAHGGIPEEIRDYAADTAAGILDDFQDDDTSVIEQAISRHSDAGVRGAEMEDALGPLLDGSLDATEVKDLCVKVVKAFKGLGDNEAIGGGGAEGSANGGGEKRSDFVVMCDGIILAYAGKSLLRSSCLRLQRGHRYGIVGQNGVGKTTLLNRIAGREISGFPADICVVYVQHEILANDEQSVVDYMVQSQVKLGMGKDEAAVQAVLSDMGFSEELRKSAVLELSGGWRMKLALAGAILSKADLLLLDEPTNHLDVNAVAWLAEYLTALSETTIVIVSHDYKFLNEVTTDIVHFADLNLTYYHGGWPEFEKARPDVIQALPKKKAQSFFAEFAGVAEALIKFPDPGVLDGVKSRLKPIMKFSDVTFRYPGGERDVLHDVSCKLSMASRVALLGANGAGKTTLLKLFVGELEQGDNKVGEVWKHHNLRVAYIAQHSMHHLEANLSLTPVTYIQDRFFKAFELRGQGRDKELAKMVTMALTEDDEKLRAKRGNVYAIHGRAVRGKEVSYQVQRTGRREDDLVWEPLSNLKCKDSYVMKLVKNYDERMKTVASGVDVRPIHETEVKAHLQNYGIEEELATSKLKGFSGGQKSRVVLAAAMWTRPHLLALDEPTNYLDKETLNALVRAIKAFKGAVLTISHNQNFVKEVANEKWSLEAGRVNMLPRDKDSAVAPPAEDEEGGEAGAAGGGDSGS